MKSIMVFVLCCIGQVVLSGNICCSGETVEQRRSSGVSDIAQSSSTTGEDSEPLLGFSQHSLGARVQSLCAQLQATEYSKVFITAEGDIEGGGLLRNDIDWNHVEFENYKKGTSEWQVIVTYYGETLTCKRA